MSEFSLVADNLQAVVLLKIHRPNELCASKNPERMNLTANFVLHKTVVFECNASIFYLCVIRSIANHSVFVYLFSIQYP